LTPTTKLRLLLLAGLFVASGTGCGARSGPGSPSAAYDREVITLEEIETVEVRTTALQLVQRMRPNWLHGRGASTIHGQGSSVIIYVNNQRTQDSLARYSAGELLEIRFLNATTATQRFGTGHGSGAIMITTR